VRVQLSIRKTNRPLVAQQRAWLDQLRDAQQAIQVRPEDCPETHFAVYFKPLEEAAVTSTTCFLWASMPARVS
jgi:hypothetical protein